MNGGRRRIFGLPTTARKDRDEDLLLFREMHKRENDRIISLLQPVSSEFEPNAGNYPLYRIASGKKECEKNDYDWLKTPPATPLFPSLEMETNAPELAIQRELPVFQPLTRFAGNSEASKTNCPPKSKLPSRSVTPSMRPKVSSSTETTNTKGAALVSNQKNIQSNSDNINKRSNISSIAITKPTNPKENPSNTSKIAGKDSKTKPTSRGVSPLVRSRIPAATITGFSDETPPNLRTDRSSSTSRGRPSNPTTTTTTTASHPKPETIKPRRQSCSPSVTRGRKMEFNKQENERESTMTRGKIQAGNGSLAFGSRMVEKVMNARKSTNGGEERETKPKVGVLANESSGYGRMMSKTSLDMALKHMEIKRDPKNFGTKNSTSRSNSSSMESSPRTSESGYPGLSWKKVETSRKFPIKGETRTKNGFH